MSDKRKCIMCEKTWSNPSTNDIIVHHLDDHQGNLSFLSPEQIFGFVEEIEEEP